jgi:hypothetical protein
MSHYEPDARRALPLDELRRHGEAIRQRAKAILDEGLEPDPDVKRAALR